MIKHNHFHNSLKSSCYIQAIQAVGYLLKSEETAIFHLTTISSSTRMSGYLQISSPFWAVFEVIQACSHISAATVRYLPLRSIISSLQVLQSTYIAWSLHDCIKSLHSSRCALTLQIRARMHFRLNPQVGAMSRRKEAFILSRISDEECYPNSLRFFSNRSFQTAFLSFQLDSSIGSTSLFKYGLQNTVNLDPRWTFLLQTLCPLLRYQVSYVNNNHHHHQVSDFTDNEWANYRLTDRTSEIRQSLRPFHFCLQEVPTTVGMIGKEAERYS